MVWKPDNSHGNESGKIRWELVPYTRGRVLDLGCGPNKAFPHFIGVDNGHHEKFGYSIKPDLMSDCEKLDFVADQSCDAVFSSHLLEHIPYENVPNVLVEWFRVIKPNGYLILYLPDEDTYPKVGEEGANPDHKFNVNYNKIVWPMKDVGGWDLVEFQKRDQDDEYSLFFVFQKKEGSKHTYSYQNPKPEKTAAVVRYGAFGDLMMCSSVLAGLKQQGFHVTLYSSPPGSDVIKHDPNIDRLILQDKDQVPNGNLGEFWDSLKVKYDRFVNLSESVEGTFLALPGRTQHNWPAPVRKAMLSHTNYLEFHHQLAGIPHKPQVRFYATEQEKAWAKATRDKMGSHVVLWSLAGSSLHKTWPYLDAILARLMLGYPNLHVVLVGGPDCEMLEAGWENEPRIHKTCGKWSIRQSLAFLDQADMVIGPETGVLNAGACLELPKVVFLSHSSHENLTRDWINTIALSPDVKDVPCYPCNMLHPNNLGWKHCWEHKETGTAMCQAQISPEKCWEAIGRAMRLERKAA